MRFPDFLLRASGRGMWPQSEFGSWIVVVDRRRGSSSWIVVVDRRRGSRLIYSITRDQHEEQRHGIEPGPKGVRRKPDPLEPLVQGETPCWLPD